MNVRIDDAGFRFRLTSADLEALLSGKEVFCAPNGFSCRIVPTDAGEARIETSGGIVLRAPRDIFDSLRDLGRSKNGLALSLGDAEVSLQLDIKLQRQAS